MLEQHVLEASKAIYQLNSYAMLIISVLQFYLSQIK
jgi:hypothetical protein